VNVGDRVLATDPETGETEGRPVEALIRHAGEHVLVVLRFSDGSTLTATDHHPVWDVTTGTFVDAINPLVGDRLLTDRGTTIIVVDAVTRDESMTAYNLQFNAIHTYFVGTTPVLVHNSCSNSLEELSEAGRRPVGTQGQTAAGQELDKHAQDSSGLFLPKASGSLAVKTERKAYSTTF
jgi:hypothetical protein